MNKFPNIEIRKTMALFSCLILGFALVYSIIMGYKDYVLMLIPTFSVAIGWYFAKSTALDKQA